MKNFTDANGREYALVSEVGPGDILIADGGFISDNPSENPDLTRDFFCLDEGSENYVHEAFGEIFDKKTYETKPYHYLYVNCRCGEHKLEGQYDKRPGYKPFYMGFYLKSKISA